MGVDVVYGIPGVLHAGAVDEFTSIRVTVTRAEQGRGLWPMGTGLLGAWGGVDDDGTAAVNALTPIGEAHRNRRPVC